MFDLNAYFDAEFAEHSQVMASTCGRKVISIVISMKTDRDWEKWAQQNAYYGVLASPEYDAPRMTDTNRARFFASGETHLKDVLQTAQACLHANITFGK